MTKMLSDDPCNCAACTLKKLMEAQTTTLKAIADFKAFMAEVAKVGEKLPVAEPKPEPRVASVMMRFTPEELEVLDAAMGALDYQIHDNPFPHDPSPADVNRLWARIRQAQS